MDRSHLEKIEVLADEFVKENNIETIFIETKEGNKIIITHFMFEFYDYVLKKLNAPE